MSGQIVMASPDLVNSAKNPKLQFVRTTGGANALGGEQLPSQKATIQVEGRYAFIAPITPRNNHFCENPEPQTACQNVDISDRPACGSNMVDGQHLKA